MFITYHMTTEGVGAQYQRVLALLAIAKIHNLKYIHRKLTVGHNYENDNLWNDKWDNLFNITKLSHHPIYVIDQIYIYKLYEPDLQLICKNTNKLFSIELPFDIIDEEPNKYYKSIQNDVIKAYDDVNKYRLLYYFNINKINIVIHIRVINSNDDGHEFKNFENLEDRFSIQEIEYIELINKLKHSYTNHNIHIFTQANIYKKYSNLSNIPDVTLHIDTDEIDAFHHMSKADVLIIAKSSFSYLAALYNKNKVLYFPFHHPPLDTWYNVKDYIAS